MTLATWSCKLQFTAGPEQTTFHACEEHKPDLEGADVSGLFWRIKGEDVKPVDRDDEIECYFCREG